MDAVLRGERPPAINKTGPVEPLCDDRGVGGASRTTCPLEPPIPELHKAIKERPDVDRHDNGVGSVGTRKRYSSHRILGFGFEKLTLGGIIPFLNIFMLFVSEARKAAISVWLCSSLSSPLATFL